MLASVATFALVGMDGREVAVEVDVRDGLPAFTVVGLPDRAVREARERVRAALQNCDFKFPPKRVTANLAPADLRKAGPSFDLALALAILAATGQAATEQLSEYAVCGELSLTGTLRPVRGAVAVAAAARRAGYGRLVVPSDNAREAALVEGLEVYGVPGLDELVELLAGRLTIRPAEAAEAAPVPLHSEPDLADVRGQRDARRALEIAAAGGHNLLMVGPPGVGKTMLARRLPGILPPPTFEEAVEITRVQSVAGIGDGRLAVRRPFRAPHHSISASGLIGGGSVPRPGEITLAHRGVLFLDEIAEFARDALEGLREPLESGHAEIVRGQRSLRFPARFMLIAACNGCPCARPSGECSCNEADHARYRRRLSGPLLDRMDLVCALDAASALELVKPGGPEPESSAAVRVRVIAARDRQSLRLAGTGIRHNAAMSPRLLRTQVRASRELRSILRDAARGGALTARGQDRVLRVARTIADLDGAERVEVRHLEEAVGYRLATSEALVAA